MAILELVPSSGNRRPRAALLGCAFLALCFALAPAASASGRAAASASQAAAVGPSPAAGSSEQAQAAKPKRKCKKRKGKSAGTAAKKKGCKKKKKKKKAPEPGGSGSPPPPPPPPAPTKTSEQLIDEAVASGQISPETGLVYKVFAVFDDPRLPSQFAGPPDPLAHPPLDQAIAGWNGLSESAKAILGPYLTPPYHEGSNWDLSSRASDDRARVAADPNAPWCAGTSAVVLESWDFVEATQGAAAGKVRVWYQDRYAGTDAALAADLLSTIETKIWPALTALMGREPLPDGGGTGFCGGGSDAVDIALVDADRGATNSTGLSQESTSARMIFPRSGPQAAKPILAHEFMHMIQFSYGFSSGHMGSGENQWLREGTAQWAQDYVSSSQYGIGLTPDQTEHQALPYFFPYPERSLDSTDPANHTYGSYVFWLWAVRAGSNPSVVPQAWNAVGSQKSLDAARSVFGAGWDQAWKDFARANWNKDPVTSYQSWDSITSTPAIAAEGTLPANEITPVLTTVGPVAAKYLRFEPASDANTLTYRNVGGLDPKAGVQAVISYKDGSKAVEDWSAVAQKDVPFCNIDELALVVSNSSTTQGDSRLFNLSFSPPSPGGGSRAAGAARRADVCLPDPQGGFSGSAVYDDGVTTTINWTWSGTVEFEPNGQMNPWFPEFATEVWDAGRVATGSVTLSGQGTTLGSDGTCTIDIPAASYELETGTNSILIQPGPQPHYAISLSISGTAFPQGTISCPDQAPQTGPFLAPPQLVYTENPQQAAVRGSYQGSTTFNVPLYTSSYTWNFVDP